jgi:ubiquinol-cytochrome c reductase iron-sulfur subunit
MPNEPSVETREVLLGEPEEREEAEASFVAGAEEIGRRKFLGGLLGAAVAALGAAFLFPIRSFGKAPGSSLYTTSWRKGLRAVTPDGTPVVAATLTDNEVLTIFPEGHLDAADSVAVLIKMPLGSFRPQPGRDSWSPENIVAFSKVCTHAGCPVGLFQAASAELLCPCHQSVFLVTEAAKPISGPATRPLPQLPLTVDADGYVVAQSDFPSPIGPGFWHVGKQP